MRAATPAARRWWSRIEVTPDCWRWTGPLSHGYGSFDNMTAHRFGYQMLVDDIPDGWQVDHLCRNRACVNPAHLEAVTASVNVRRSENHAAARARQTHCIHGHALEGRNLLIRLRNGRPCRECRQCNIDRPLAAYRGRRATA